MSKWVSCEICGELKEVPAFEGDGVYHDHYCNTETNDENKAEEKE